VSKTFVILTKELIQSSGKGKPSAPGDRKIAFLATEMSHDAAHHKKGAAAVGASRAGLNHKGS
jgi:hypothetical protein